MNSDLKQKLNKHARVIVYLGLSAIITYVVSLFAGKPELVYFTPITNYILFVLEKELKEEGVVKTMIRK